MKPYPTRIKTALLPAAMFCGLVFPASLHADLINGDFSSTSMTSGNGDAMSLDQGWYAKNADNGTNTTINWSAGATVATPGVLTHTSNSGTKTRVGQFFTKAVGLSGTGWAFEFDLDGTASAELLRVWTGTLAGSPGGTAISTTGDAAPSASLVDASGWTQIVNTGALSGTGHHSFPISQDLGNYDVMVIKFRGRSANTGTTYDNFEFVNAPVTEAPVAGFTADPTSGVEPLEVNFTDTSTNAPTSWEWDFENDGTPDSTDQNPTFTYITAGTYDVKLTATNAIGSDTVTEVALIVVDPPPPPTANFTADVTAGPAPLMVNFTDTSTGDPTSWSWDFGDTVGTSTDQDPSYTYPNPGTYDVTLTATNAQGPDDGVKVGYITVGSPSAPTANFTATPLSGVVPLTVTFADTSTDFPTELDWDFDGDGTPEVLDDPNPNWTYTAAGSYTVKLIARNALGETTETKTDLITVIPLPTGIVNGDFSSTALNHGNGDETSLGNGWFAKNADDGVRADPFNWSAGATVGTAGVLTQTSSSGSATRIGQFFVNGLAGTGWAFEFDLGGTGSLSYLRMWGGTLAASPSGTAVSTTGDTGTPPASLVDAGGWTKIVDTGAISGASGTQSFPIAEDLGGFDVMIIQIKGSGGTSGTSYDSFQFAQSTATADPLITSISVSGTTATLGVAGTDGTDYWLASSTDLVDFSTEEVPNEGSPFQTAGGTATLTLDVTGDAELFLRMQDADPAP